MLFLLIILLLLSGCTAINTKEKQICLTTTHYSTTSIPNCSSQYQCYNKVNPLLTISSNLPTNIYSDIITYSNNVASADYYFNKSKTNLQKINNTCDTNSPKNLIFAVNDLFYYLDNIFTYVDLASDQSIMNIKDLVIYFNDQNIDLILTSVLADVNSQNFGQTYFIDSTLVVRSDFGSYGLIETDIYLKKNKIVAANSKAIEFNEKIKEDVKTRQFINKFYLSVAQQVKDFREIHLWEKQAEKVGFVGAQNCIDCHELQYNQWKITAHATSYHTLTKRHRNYYPNCVQCHVTAFDFKPGFSLSKINDKTFQNVQCEMCHGPGSQHITDPMSKSLLRNPTYEYCVQCHTNDHSDLTKLNFSEYYKKVAH